MCLVCQALLVHLTFEKVFVRAFHLVYRHERVRAWIEPRPQSSLAGDLRLENIGLGQE